jgi:hypothetical protein
MPVGRPSKRAAKLRSYKLAVSLTPAEMQQLRRQMDVSGDGSVNELARRLIRLGLREGLHTQGSPSGGRQAVPAGS